MNNTGLIIGLTGRAGHGKNYVAGILSEYYPRMCFRQVAFADAVKKVYQIISGERVRDSLEWKNSINPIFGLTRREMYQRIGTDAMRDQVHPDVWVNALFRVLDPSENYIITDVRFKNEADAIFVAGGKIFRVFRPNFEPDAPLHRSDVDLDGAVFETIINPGNGDMAIKAQIWALEEAGKIF